MRKGSLSSAALGVNAEAKPACGGGRRLKPPIKDTGVALGCYVSALRGDQTDAPTLIAAGKILTRVPRYATLPSCAARHDKIKRTGTDLEAGTHWWHAPWFNWDE